MRITKLKSGFEVLGPEKARLIAHLIGDGCVYKCRTDYNIKYDIIDEELLNQFISDFNEVYGIKIPVRMKKSGKTDKMLPYLRVRSKLAFDDLKKYCDYLSRTWSVPNQIFAASYKIKKEFLMALYDDEGSVIPYGKSVIIRLYSINLSGLKQVRKLLDEFGIKTKIQEGFGLKRNVYSLTTKEINSFYEKLGFYCVRKQKKLEKGVGMK